MKNIITIFVLVLSSMTALGQATSGLSAPSVSTVYPNAGTTGTTLNTLTKLTGAPSTVVIAATSDTSGVIGVTVGNAGTSGVAFVQANGLVNLIFDGATTAGDYVQISSTTAGNGHDTGSGTCPTSGQVVGRVLSTHGSGGTYQINLGANGCGSGGGSSFITSLTTAGTSGAAAVSGGVLNIPQYQGSITLTTTGSSGAATLSGTTLNIPQYSGGGGGYTNVIGSGSQTTVSALNTLCSGGTLYATTPLSIATGGTITCPVQFSKAGLWTIASGQTITFTGAVTETDQPSQIFAGSGTVAFSSSNYASPSVQAHAPVEWWGAKGDNSTADLTPIQACLNALPVQCDLEQGTYVISGALSITTSNVGIHGQSYIKSLIKLTSATSNGITVAGTGLGGSEIQGNIFDNFVLYRSVVPTSSSAAGLSFSFCQLCKISWVFSQDSAQGFYLTNFANSVMSDSWATWTENYGGGLTDVYGIYVDGANQPQSSQFQRDVVDVVGAVGTTFHGFVATGNDIGDILSDNLQISNTNYAIELTDSGGGGFHASDIHFTNNILDGILTSCIKTTNASPSENSAWYFNGGECTTNSTSSSSALIDLENSQNVHVSHMQVDAHNDVTANAVLINGGTQNVITDNNLVAPRLAVIQMTGTTSNVVSNNIINSGNNFSNALVNVTSTSTNNTFSSNPITDPSSLSVGMAFDATSGSNTALSNRYSLGGGSTTVSDTAGTNQWCDASACHNVGSGAVSSVSNSDGTLTISPTTGAVVGSLALGHANTWTGQQTFVAPVLGTPASGVLTNATGLPAASVVAGSLANGMAATTQTGGDSTTKLATTAFVQAAIAAASTGAGIVTYSGPSLTLTGTQYLPIGGGGLASSTETNVDLDSPAAATIQNFSVQMSAAPGVGNTVVFTWRKNAAGTALTCTITGASQTSCNDATHSFTVVQGDLMDIQTVTTGTIAGTPTLVMGTQFGIAASGSFQYSVLPVPSAIAGWTWINQQAGGAAASATQGTGGAIDFVIPTSSTLQWQFLKNNTTLPSTPWSVQMYSQNLPSGTNGSQYTDWGLYLYDGTKMEGIENLSLGITNCTAGATNFPLGCIRVERMTNVSTDSASVAGPTLEFSTAPQSGWYLRWCDTGTTRYAEWSLDGYVWHQMYSEATGSFMTPTFYGVGGTAGTSGSAETIGSLQGISVTSGATCP